MLPLTPSGYNVPWRGKGYYPEKTCIPIPGEKSTFFSGKAFFLVIPLETFLVRDYEKIRKKSLGTKRLEKSLPESFSPLTPYEKTWEKSPGTPYYLFFYRKKAFPEKTTDKKPFPKRLVLDATPYEKTWEKSPYTPKGYYPVSFRGKGYRVPDSPLTLYPLPLRGTTYPYTPKGYYPGGVVSLRGTSLFFYRKKIFGRLCSSLFGKV